MHARFTPILALLLGLAGCQTARPWGSTATLLPSGERLRRAALTAVTDPNTWVPAAGAILFAAARWDQPVSDWATKHTPVFGSVQSAQDASDVLFKTLRYATIASMIATPSGCDPKTWLLNKAKGAAVEGAALYLSGELTITLKDSTRRLRPDGTDRASWPSGHSSGSASFAATTRRNVEDFGWPRGPTIATQGVLTTMAALTAWARVEGKKHYPSDVMAGAALGSFVATFVHDAFLGRARDDWSLGLGADDRGFALQIGHRF